MNLRTRRLASVIGKGKNCPQEIYELGFEIGSALGKHKDELILLNGGLDGVMESSSKGFHEAGGLVIGILPALYDNRVGNRFLDISLNTGLDFHVRNVVVASACDFVIAAPGSHGTLQEIAVALDLNKPVWALGNHGSNQLAGVNYLHSLEELEDELESYLKQQQDLRGES